MKDVKIEIVPLDPEQNENSILYDQYVLRKTGVFQGENVISITIPKEAIWWNRPLDSDQFLKKESDGLYSYNLPFMGTNDIYRVNYNILIAKNSIPIAVQIRFDDSWTEEQKTSVYNMSYDIIYESLIDLGVNKDKLSRPRNDILYENKKFAGGEKKIINNVFSEDLVITLKFLPEQDIFNRLTGKYAHVRGITGIEEEDPRVTREALMSKLIEKYTDFFESL